MGYKPIPELPARRRGFVPRTLAELMAVVALSALAFAVLTPRAGPAAPRPPLRLSLMRPRAVPIPTFPGTSPTVSVDEGIFRPAPEGVDDRMVVAAPEGIDDAMVVSADPASRRRVVRALPLPHTREPVPVPVLPAPRP
jgi:hypothetical protein